MRKNVFSLIFKMWSIIILCSVILIGCETSGDYGNEENTEENTEENNKEEDNKEEDNKEDIHLEIRPAKIDLNGVCGFVVVENSSNAPKTRADGNETENENVETSYSHSLYTIDENGELHISIFYFEVTPSEDGNIDSLETKIMKEVSEALQIVPSLVSDLGKYILFSECQYKINNINISNSISKDICETYIQNNYRENMTYIIRKSDGALFDLTDQSIFTYEHELNSTYIPTYSYMTSPKGNLFSRSGGDSEHVSKIVDNGNDIDVKQMTQDYWMIESFIVDANENIYIYAPGGTPGYLDVYLSNGKFDVIDVREYLDYFGMHMKYDDNNIAYLFYDKVYDDEKGNDVHVITAGTLLDGKCIERNKIETDDWKVWEEENYYIGYSNGDFKWFSARTLKTLTYNKDRDEWILEDIPEDLRNIYTEKYDLLLSGIKSYGVNVKGNTIEINEIDMVNKSYRQYSFDVDISFIKAQSYYATMANETPYLFISGKSSESGADVSFMINLANGENNSTFATDNRNVVSFFRIN